MFLFFLSCICLCWTLCIVTYFLHKVPFLYCLFIIVCIVIFFLLFFFLSLLLKEPAFINQRNEIPLCTARACLRRKRFTSTITLWLLALLVFNFFFFFLCSNLLVKKNIKQILMFLSFSFDAGESELPNIHVKRESVPRRREQYEMTVKRWYG